MMYGIEIISSVYGNSELIAKNHKELIELINFVTDDEDFFIGSVTSIKPLQTVREFLNDYK